mmetsp:Transcript_45903/g.95472  ORF Transcript_45903/g.95472 Transcript_45903/m.95472 type:complete len:118 (-) Transcript_45903:178-531(-)
MKTSMSSRRMLDIAVHMTVIKRRKSPGVPSQCVFAATPPSGSAANGAATAPPTEGGGQSCSQETVLLLARPEGGCNAGPARSVPQAVRDAFEALSPPPQAIGRDADFEPLRRHCLLQ